VCFVLVFAFCLVLSWLSSVSCFILKGFLPRICGFINETRFHNPTSSVAAHNKCESVLLCLNPGAFISSFMRKVLDGIFFQNNAVSSMLNTCSGLYPFSMMSCFNVSG
uniref:Secreted protein n=1 Tax=Oryzias latipes TaxID=8090 RepID=A0A3P9J746_ORYLA